MGLSVPSDRWNKGKQRIKVLQSIHRNERMDYEVLNKRLDAREDLIHSESPSVHIRPWKGSYMA